MKIQMTINDAARWLEDKDNILILAHRRPDGDALGSAAALARGLNLCGKTAYILKNPEMTDKFIAYVKKYHAPHEFVPEHIVSVDTATADLLQTNAEPYAQSVELCVDHHMSNSKYAQNLCLDAQSASCGELIYKILREMGVTIDAELATLLYIAVSTDTGCFSYSNTVADTLETAARFVEAGADNKGVNKLFFRTKSKNRIKFEGVLLSGIEFCFDDKAAFMTVRIKDRVKYDITENDLEDIASIPITIENVCIGITIKEINERECKISVRTVDGYNANLLCAAFGGGGHPAAAGCIIKAPANEAKEMIEKEIYGLWDL